MIGNPYEKSHYRQTIRLALQLDLDYAQFSKVTPMPATEMYTLMLKERGRDFWREHIERGTDEDIPRPLCNNRRRNPTLDTIGLSAILLPSKLHYATAWTHP